MLALQRKHNQAVVLVKDGKVIARISLLNHERGGAARLGFESDRDVLIYRDEIWREKLREAAAVAAMPAAI